MENLKIIFKNNWLSLRTLYLGCSNYSNLSIKTTCWPEGLWPVFMYRETKYICLAWFENDMAQIAVYLYRENVKKNLLFKNTDLI